jgi:putative ABC transport system substrate-binding protein
MKKKITFLTLCAMLFAPCSFAEAQQPKKFPRIGYLLAGDATIESARSEAIRLALRERGYIEGQNIATDYRYAEGKPDRILSLRSSWCDSTLISS